MLLDQLLWFVPLCVLLVVLIFNRVPLFMWTVLTALTFVHSLFYSTSLMWQATTAITTLVFLIFLIRPLRRNLITAHLFSVFKNVLPVISPTERAALEAGDVWWEGDLFRGLPDWSKIQDRAKPVLTTEERHFLDHQTNKLCHMLNNWEFCNDGMDMPLEVWNYLKQERFFGMIIPKEYGGHGFSALMHSSVVTRICTRSPSAAITVMVPNALGPAELLLAYGSDEQKQHYLPRLARGEDIPCFGLTAADAGSDASAIKDTGVVCKGTYEGKTITGVKLNFDKRYITLAPVATLLGVAFKLHDPENLLGRGTDLGITLCLIPASLPGIYRGPRHIPSHSPFLNGPLVGKDVFIPLEMLIGGIERAGQGWKMLVECLAAGRGISLPALSTASVAHCYKMTGAYAKIREQFGVSIGKFEGVQEAMARIGANAYILEAVRTFTVSAIDEGKKPSIATAISKYHMTEFSRQAINDAMDIHGGKALMEGPNNYLTPFYFSTVIAITVEGANILTRNLMIFGQGAVRCHPYVLEEITGLSDKNRALGLKRFDKALFAHVGYTLANAVRAFVLAFTSGWYSMKQHQQKNKKVSFWQRQLGRYSCALALVSDIAMLVLGGDLKRRERLSARLADVLSQLYLGSAVLTYYQQQGELADDEVYLSWCMHHHTHQIEEAFIDFFDNFPKPRIAKLLKFVVMPLGRKAHKPHDRHGKKIAHSMMEPSLIRGRLTSICGRGYSSDDCYTQMELAFQAICNGDTTKEFFAATCKTAKLPKSMTFLDKVNTLEQDGLLSQAQAKTLREMEEWRAKIIKVDQFNDLGTSIGSAAVVSEKAKANSEVV